MRNKNIDMPEYKDTANISVRDTVVVEPFIKASYPKGLTDTVVVQGCGQKQLHDYAVMTVDAGREPETYYKSPIKSTGILLMLVISFLIIAFCYRNGRKYFSTLVSNTWSVRRTKNHLDDHTMTETLTMLSLILQTVIMEGLIAFSAFKTFGIEMKSVGTSVLAFVAFAGLLYVAQILIFRMIGFIFAKKIETDLWVQGFNASQSLMGLIISPVAILMLFFPVYSYPMLIIAAIIYITARFAFLLKSFRVFYSNLFQCFYFILYLCALEIVPYVVLYRALFS